MIVFVVGGPFYIGRDLSRSPTCGNHQTASTVIKFFLVKGLDLNFDLTYYPNSQYYFSK